MAATMPATTMLVPRSPPMRISPNAVATPGTRKGTTTWPIWPSRSRLRVRTKAPKSTSPNFTSSEGWMDTGPKRSQLRLPLTLVPMKATRSCRPSAITNRGTLSRFHAGTGSREASTSATVPIAAYTAWPRKIVKADCDSLAASEVTAEAESTMIRPKTTSVDVTMTSR
jgi:hypothetical protein